MKEERQVKLRNLLAYGSGDFFGGGSFLIIGMLFVFFLTDVVGLSPAMAAFVFAIGKVWDAISDPLMGYVSDHTQSRYGRRRIYFLIAIAPVAIGFILMWNPVHFDNQYFSVAYYSIAYLLFNTIFTMVMVPYSALNAEMTMDYKTRTKLSGARIIFSQISALFAGTIPKFIINSYTDPVKKILEPVKELSLLVHNSPTNQGEAIAKLQAIVQNLQGSSQEQISQLSAAYTPLLSEALNSMTNTSQTLPQMASVLGSHLERLQSGLQNTLQGANETGFLVMAILFGILYAIPWIIVYLGTWELPYSKDKTGSLLSVFQSFGSIFSNKSFRIHILMYIFAYSAMDVLMVMFIYFLKYSLGNEQLYPVAMGSLLGTQILMLPVYVMISNKFGKAHAYIMGLSIMIVGMLLSGMIDTQASAIQLAAVCVVIGAGLSAGVMIPWAILPSVTDVDEMITTQKRAGIYSGAMTLVRKMVQGLIAIPMVGLILELIGYTANQAQSAQTLENMRLFFILGPTSFLLLGVIVAFFFKITPKTHKVMVNELNRLRDGGDKSKADDESKKICELLTGHKYENLYTKR